jgi:predicted nucleic acid-binding protein
MKAVLDTSVVIASGVPDLGGELGISAVTLAELHFGVLVARDPATRAERLRRLSILQQRFDPLAVDEAVAASYGQLAAAVVAAGRQPRARVMDLLIAATAHAHSARLYTRNAPNLAGAEGLLEIVPV